MYKAVESKSFLRIFSSADKTHTFFYLTKTFIILVPEIAILHKISRFDKKALAPGLGNGVWADETAVAGQGAEVPGTCGYVAVPELDQAFGARHF